MQGRRGDKRQGPEEARELAARLLRGDFEQAFSVADRMVDAGLRTDTQVQTLFYPFTWAPAGPALRRRLARVMAGLERYAGQRPGGPYVPLYRMALDSLLGRDTPNAAWDRTYYRPLLEAAQGRYLWMRIQAGHLNLRRGRFGQAARDLAPVARGFPHFAIPWCMLAEALLGLGRRHEALACLDGFRGGAPESISAYWSWKGEIHLWLGEDETAAGCLERAAPSGSPLTYCWRGAVQLRLGRMRQALEDLDRAVREFPEDSEAWTWRGEACRLAGRYAESLRDIKRAISVIRRYKGKPVFAVVNRGLARQGTGDLAGMERDFRDLRADGSAWVRFLQEGDPRWAPEVSVARGEIPEMLRRALALARGNRRWDYSVQIMIAVNRTSRAA